MKAIVKTNGFVLCHVGNLARNVIFAAIILYLLASLGMAQSPLPDSIVQITAEARGLELLAPSDVPPSGTFWQVSPDAGGGVIPPPLPCPPVNLALPIFKIANGQYLIDGTVGQAPAGISHASRMSTSVMTSSDLETQASAVANLISQIQDTATPQATVAAGSATMSSMDSSSPPSPPGSGGDTNSSGYGVPAIGAVPINTNLLWLQISNVINGYACGNIYNTTDYVYAVWFATNLLTPAAQWSVASEVFPTATNCTPFTAPTLNQTTLFLRAEDWTGVTHNGNTTPDWWFWEYYGTTDSSDTALDSQGNTLLSDYTGGVDPNIIQFSLSAPNQYVNSVNAPMQVKVTTGVPFFIATLVDDTNFAGATWNPYTSPDITLNLGSTQGWHDVWVGLRGLPPNAVQTWQWRHLNLALQPVLVITNPIGNLVTQPMIQVSGYCQEPLASISYDLSNAAGVITGLPSEITDQYYDTTACGFTTNYFECLDVPLTNGLNIITIHATDLAGNMTTSNFSFTLDYSSKTNPPTVQLTWPQSGAQVSGGTFTCRGVITDPTASVTAQVVFTNSNTTLFVNGIYTNVYVASVERNGNFWLENLPLNLGTNKFIITIKDAAGNMSETNISIIQSTLTLTINPVPASQLWQPTANLTGTVSTTNYAVWVNGVKGHNNGDGTWSASNVPVNSGGTANFTATAYAPNEQQPDGSYNN
jgi:hypothetical protein